MNAGRIGGEMVQKAMEELSIKIDVDVRGFSVYLLVTDANTYHYNEAWARVFYNEKDAYDAMIKEVDEEKANFIESGFSEGEIVISLSNESASLSSIANDAYVTWEISKNIIQ